MSYHHVIYFRHLFLGVPGGPIVSCATIEVEVVGSNPTRGSCLQTDRPKARERELAKFDANRRAKEAESWNAEPYTR